MTTIAEMTPAQRYDCVGMWATVSSERYLAVICRIYVGNPDLAQMYSPEIDDYYTSSLESVTPRFDLPRAWLPCGTPQAGEWDYRAPYLGKYGEGLTDTEIAEFKADGDQLERRWVGNWEEIGTDGRTNNEQPSKNR